MTDSEENAGAPRFVTIRAMAIACALMPPLALWTVKAGMIRYAGHSTTISLFFHVTFTLFLICLLNLAVERWRPRAALAPSELLTIYMMLAVAGTFCSTDLLQVMIPMLGFPKYFANPQNNWENTILKHIPDFAILGGSEEARDGLAVGNASMYRWTIIRSWAVPFAFWFTFLMVLMGALLCINIVFRRQWTERERLSFPVIQVPLMLATNLRGLLQSRLFWLAFIITGTIDLINGINFYVPNFPRIPVVRVFTFVDYFVERPWSAIAHTEVNLFPFVIGLVFFMPTDLAFSCWFFFLFFKAQIVLSSAIGLNDIPGFPFPTEQAAGGYLALALLAIWLSRRHLRGVGRSVFGRPGGADDSQEAMSYRATAILLTICVVILVVQGMMLGGSWYMMILFFGIFFLYAIAIARMRAELGPPAHDLHFMGPDILIENAAGTRNLGNDNLAAFTAFFWFNRAYRAHFSAHSMEGFKLAQLSRVTARSMMIAMLVAIVAGALAAFWSLWHLLYVHGYSGRPAGDAFSMEAWNRFNTLMTFPQRPNIGATGATAFGLIFAIVLGALRMRFTWWLWHPVGFATATTWSMEKLWFCIFLGWLAKALIVRYGGAPAHRRALPFFVGLIMGEFTVGSLWSAIGTILDTGSYHFFG